MESAAPGIERAYQKPICFSIPCSAGSLYECRYFRLPHAGAIPQSRLLLPRLRSIVNPPPLVRPRAVSSPRFLQTFPNLSCLQLLDNDIRSLKQLERLRPILRGLTALQLGKNPVAKTASPAALQAWVGAQSPGLRLHNHHPPGGAAVAQASHPQPASRQRPRLPPPGSGDNDALLPAALGGGGAGDRPRGGGESGGGPGGALSEEIGSGDRTVGGRLDGAAPSAWEAGRSTGGGGRDLLGDRAVATKTPADAAFERLAQARSRAATSSWGAVALARLKTAESRAGGGGGGGHGGGGGGGGGSLREGEPAKDSASAWSASARGAKLACNGMVSAKSRQWITS